MNIDFYQQAISDPHSQCPDFLAAMASDPQLQEVQQQQLAQELKLSALFGDAPTPSQTHLDAINAIGITDTQQKSWSVMNYLAIAASLVLCVVSLKYIDISPTGYNQKLVSHALNHAAHGHSYAGVTNTHPSLTNVNVQLASYGVSLESGDDLIWNKDCDFEGITSAHLVFQDKKAKINVYVVPDSYEFSQIERIFNDDRYQGTIKKVSNNYLIIIAPKGHDLAPVSGRINRQLQWQI